MSHIDAADFSSLSAAVEQQSKEDILAAVQSAPGGPDEFIDKVFAGMQQAFNPSKAGDQKATIQYELGLPDGTREYAMRVADGRCEVERGTANNPRVTIKVGLVDFLGLITGKANGVQLFMTGKLKVSGDLFFAQSYQAWFDRPA